MWHESRHRLLLALPLLLCALLGASIGTTFYASSPRLPSDAAHHQTSSGTAPPTQSSSEREYTDSQPQRPPTMSTQKRFFAAFGKVQGVMFRQTLMRAAQSRSLYAAATNCKVPAKDKVVFELEGDNSKIEEIVESMRSGKELNSWKAKVVRLEEVEASAAAVDRDRNPYQVSTDNVDEFRWTPGVEFYL